MHASRMRLALPSVPMEALLARRAYQRDHSAGVLGPPSVPMEVIFRGSLVRFSYFLLDTTTRRLSGAISCRQSHIYEPCHDRSDSYRLPRCWAGVPMRGQTIRNSLEPAPREWAGRALEGAGARY
jgi:hypothetical protein